MQMKKKRRHQIRKDRRLKSLTFLHNLFVLTYNKRTLKYFKIMMFVICDFINIANVIKLNKNTLIVFEINYFDNNIKKNFVHFQYIDCD